MRIVVFFLFFLCLTAVSSQVTLLEENFDAQGLPAGWERIVNDNNTPAADVSEYTEAWIYKEDPINAGNGTFSSTSYFDPVDRADRWLITPSITLGNWGNYISWKGLSADPSFPDSYKVVVSTTTSDISAFTDTLLIVSNETAEWASHEESLDAYANQTIHIAFVNTTFDGFKLYLDSVDVREQDPLNIIEEKNISLNLFPNPVEDKITLQAEKMITAVSVFSTLGKRVANIADNSQNSLQLDLSALPQGVYHVQIRLVNGVIVRKKVVKK